MELRRLQGWERTLADYLAANRDRPFEWGAWDCASAAILTIRELTGELIWPVTWTTAAEAARTIEGAGGMIAAWTDTLGRPSQNWRTLRRGDVGLVDMGGRDSMTICTGQSLCGPGIEKLEHLPLNAARLVWRVG